MTEVPVPTEQLLKFLADRIDKGFNGPNKDLKKTWFFLAIAPYGCDMTQIPKPEVHYIANMTDEEIGVVLKDVFDGIGYHCFLKGKPNA